MTASIEATDEMDDFAGVERDGFALFRGVFSLAHASEIAADLAGFLANDKSEAVRRSEQGHVFAARNVLSVWPDAVNVWRKPPLERALLSILGPGFGLVRGLYFDKPPEHTWSLPWHKDLTIAVRDNRLPSPRFTKPTRKVGVPHVEAPVEVLEQMLTARIHLDAATVDNGVLFAVPGSHRHGKAMESTDAGAIPITAEAGDVLLIRPLVSHCSGKSTPGTARHRRILHLEFAAKRELPDGFEWHQFHPGAMPSPGGDG